MTNTVEPWGHDSCDLVSSRSPGQGRESTHSPLLLALAGARAAAAAGQGTIAQEIIAQTTKEQVDAVFCCIGGGASADSGVGLLPMHWRDAQLAAACCSELRSSCHARASAKDIVSADRSIPTA